MADSEFVAATVAALFGRRLLLETADFCLHRAQLPNRQLRPLCGDRVQFQWRDGEAVIQSIEPRESTLWRQDKQRRKRAVAANVDCMVIVAAPAPLTTGEQLDRYLAIATLCDIRAIIISNKCDLDSYPPWSHTCEQFSSLGYDVIASSVKTADGVAQLQQLLHGRQAVMAGLSGVGKSSLINALVPDLEVRTAALSAASGGGRHTTTASRLYRLGTGGWIIDAPGVRDIRLWSMSPPELAPGFVEFAPFTERCKFNDCRHQHEPGCALRTAVEGGIVSKRRYRSFCHLAARLINN